MILFRRSKPLKMFFEDDDVYTDVLFYAYPNQVYSAVVRTDYYTDFILQLMKHQLIQCVEWTV